MDDDRVDTCVICGEAITREDVIVGEYAEMYHLEDAEGGVCHTSCGLSRRWVVA